MNNIMELPSTIKIRCYENQNTFKLNPIPKLQKISYKNFNIFSEDKKYNEVLEKNMIVKPYYDIDIGFEEEMDMIRYTDSIIEEWSKILFDIYDNCSLAICIGNRYKKNPSPTHIKKKHHYFVSLHFIVNGHYIKQGDLKEYNKKLGLEKHIGYDNSVYKSNQLFRMVNQSKPEIIDINSKTIPFKPKTFHRDNEIKFHIIQLTKNDNLSEMKYHKLEEKIIPKTINTNYDKASIDKIKKYLFPLEKQSHDDYIRICLAVYNETNGSQEGKELLKEWSKKIGYDDFSDIENNWKYWNDDSKDHSVTLGSIIHYHKEQIGEIEDNKKVNIYEILANKHYKQIEKKEDGKTYLEYQGEDNEDEVVFELNKKLIYNNSTSEIISILDKDTWVSKKLYQIKQDYEKYKYYDKKSEKYIHPINLWMNSLHRKEVKEINFDPTNNPNNDIFNLWTGYKIKKEDCNLYNENECKPLLDHIYHRWCNGNMIEYDYVLNYLAHIIQRPHIKTGVILCLRSLKEGAGKGIVLNKLREIIGNNHYFQSNNIEQIINNFNGISEGKILMNLDEAFWGKDKSKEGILKNIITEETKLINKKNKEAYVVDDYSNYIISTNNRIFIPATTSGRRFYCLELSNEMAGIQTTEKKIMINKILDVSSYSFAKVLYNRDITHFNPREFTKTALLQEQIEHNWDNVKTWWYDILREERFCGKSINNYCHFGDIPILDNDINEKLGIKIPTYKYDKNRHKLKDENGYPLVEGYKIFYDKEFLYNNYLENTINGYKYSKQGFFEIFKNHCIGDKLFKQCRFKGISNKYFFNIKDIEIYRNKFNELEEYNYEYDDYDYISDYESDDE